jgi:hypothetical protein
VAKLPQVAQPSTKFYYVHIELEDPAETEVLSLLRVYGKSKSGEEWRPLQPIQTASQTEAVFQLEYTATAEGLGINGISGNSQQGISAADGEENSGIPGLTKVLAQRLKVLNQAMTGPSWITVTVLSKNLHNFKIWFSDDDQQQHKAVEEDDGVMGTNPLFIIVGAIIMCCGGLIGALICFFKGPDNVKYQRLDKPPADLTEGADDGDDSDEQVDIGMEDMSQEVEDDLEGFQETNEADDTPALAE